MNNTCWCKYESKTHTGQVIRCSIHNRWVQMEHKESNDPKMYDKYIATRDMIDHMHAAQVEALESLNE